MGGPVPTHLVRGSINVNDMMRTVTAGGPLAFVFDCADCTTSFDDLKYIHDAAREPLRLLPDDAFEKLYKLPRKLSFAVRAERTETRLNWWEVY